MSESAEETDLEVVSADDSSAVARFEKARKSWGIWAAYLLFLVLFTWAYIFLGAGLILRDDDGSGARAGQPYLDAVYRAADLRERDPEEGDVVASRFTSWLPQYTDGFVDPLWPWLVQGFSGDPPEELLRKGRWLNLFLCCGLLVLLGIGAARAFSFTGAAAMLLMGGFGIILERSTYFTPDAIYILLVVLAWLCGLSLIRHNQLWIYGMFGFLLGLIFLAKPPIWPLLLAFLAVSAVRTVVEVIRNRLGVEISRLWVNSNQMVGLAILATAFILVAGPRMSYSSSVFGNPFHSYTHFATWTDTPEEALQSFLESGEGEGMSWRERPGVVRFIEQRGVGELMARASAGAREQLRSSVLGRQGGIILYAFFAFLVVAVIHRWTARKKRDEIWEVRGTSARWMMLFLCFGVLFTLFYVGIGTSNVQLSVMTTALFLPILMTFIWIAERYRRQLQRTDSATLVNYVYGILMLLPILWISFRVLATVRAALA